VKSWLEGEKLKQRESVYRWRWMGKGGKLTLRLKEGVDFLIRFHPDRYSVFWAMAVRAFVWSVLPMRIKMLSPKIVQLQRHQFM